VVAAHGDPSPGPAATAIGWSDRSLDLTGDSSNVTCRHSSDDHEIAPSGLLGGAGRPHGDCRLRPSRSRTPKSLPPPGIRTSKGDGHSVPGISTTCLPHRSPRCSDDPRRDVVSPPRHGRRATGGDGGESNSPSRTLRRRPLRACPMVCRRPPGRASAPCRTVQSRAPRSGLAPDYATLIRIAAPLHDASTTRGTEVASTLTLPPKRRGRESTGGCQVLRFAA